MLKRIQKQEKKKKRDLTFIYTVCRREIEREGSHEEFAFPSPRNRARVRLVPTSVVRLAVCINTRTRSSKKRKEKKTISTREREIAEQESVVRVLVESLVVMVKFPTESLRLYLCIRIVCIHARSTVGTRLLISSPTFNALPFSLSLVYLHAFV